MTIEVIQAVAELGSEALQTGAEPTTEAEYNERIEILHGGARPAWSEVQTKQTEMQASVDANDYAHDRDGAYTAAFDKLDGRVHQRALGFQMDALLEAVKGSIAAGKFDSTTELDAMLATRDQIRTNNPKPAAAKGSNPGRGNNDRK